MGLCVDVGRLARCVAAKDREAVRELKRDLEKINDVLKANGLPEHHEPETLPGGWCCRVAGHYLAPLKRLAAHARERLLDDEDAFEEWPEPWDTVWHLGFED